jgi:hypothetical protein
VPPERSVHLQIHGRGGITLSPGEIRALLAALGDRHERLRQKIEGALEASENNPHVGLAESEAIVLVSELSHHAVTTEQRRATRKARSGLQHALQSDDAINRQPDPPPEHDQPGSA